MNRPIILFFVSFCTVFTFGAYGQVTMPSDNFTTHDGIPQIQVTDMLQDSKGYLWVSTKRGVAKFDGTKWRAIPKTEKMQVNAIAENSKGEILLFPNQSGISYFYKIVGNNLERSQAQLYNLTAWNTVCKNDTLFHFNVLESKLQHIDLSTMILTGEIEIDISKYGMWKYSDEHGLILTEKRSDNTRAYIRERDRKLLLEQNIPKNSYPVRKVGDNIIYHEVDDHLELYNTNSFQKIATVKTKNQKFVDALVDIPEDFFFCDGEFNYRINPKNNQLEKLNMINTTRNIFLVDSDGNLWNSSEAGLQFFPTINFTSYDYNGLNDAWFFQPYKDHFIYGNYSGGIKKVNLDPLQIKQVKSGVRNSVYFDPSFVGDKLYIPGSSYISIYENGKLDYIDVRSINTPLLGSHYDQSSGKIYFGGLKSLLELNQDGSYVHHKDLKDIFSRYIISMEDFDEENLILGSSEDLTLFNKESKEFSSLNHLFTAKENAGGISMAKDNRGNIWVGNNSGLWFLNTVTQEMKHIGPELFKAYVISLMQIKDGLLAIGTNKELMYLNLDTYYDKDELIVKSFNHKNGFKGEEVGQNGFALQDSILWIPTATKLICTNVNNFEFDKPFSNLEITSINGQPYIKNSNQDSIYNLTYGVSDLEVEVNVIGFNLPTLSEFQYILEGYNNNWSEWTTDEKISMRNLASGDYTLKVRAKNGSKLGTEYPEQLIKLRIDMPFYMEPDFYKNAMAISLFLLGLIGLLMIVIYQRTTSKRDLDNQFKLLQVQTLQLQLNPHFLFNVLGTIQSLILAKDYENANKYLVSFSKMIRRYLDYNVSAYKSLQSDKKDAIKISLEEELDIIKIYLEFEKLQLEEKFKYNIEIDPNIDTNDFKIPPLIIQPLLENAIKHGVVPKQGSSSIEIKIDQEDDGVKITILDDGIGIARSSELQKSSIKEFKSQSLELINQRIQVLNTMGENLSLNIEEIIDYGVEQTIFFGQTQNQSI